MRPPGVTTVLPGISFKPEIGVVVIGLFAAICYCIKVIHHKPDQGQVSNFSLPTSWRFSPKFWLSTILLFLLIASASFIGRVVLCWKEDWRNGKAVAAFDLLALFDLSLGEGCSVSYYFQQLRH